ncbi:C-type lectin domain 17, member A [Desmophyllum pertusum]|uniref:C-type lectin domain 17, member A n=1 Tax=Desmophyllum pertusum TaxID=174260 RepID=A0A9W9Y994_9CNID|nr:C-type lectin domain 17, member A [Desmophyllum pertusum]
MKFFLIILTVLVANCYTECDKGWESFESKCFKFFDEEKSWKGAEESCEESDAHLVKIDSKKKNSFLLNTFMQIPFDKLTREAWIGLTDKENEGEFVWTDGTSPTYVNWAEEQPNDQNNEQDCGEIVNGVFWPGGLSQKGLWNDYQCGQNLTYICEKKQ